MSQLRDLTLRVKAQAGDGVVGSAVALDTRHIVSCAHVLEARAKPDKPALGTPTVTPVLGDRVMVSRAAEPSRPRAATLVAMGDPLTPTDDFALLRLDEPLDHDIAFRLSDRLSSGHRFDAFGFPIGYDLPGNIAHGVIGAANSLGMVQLNADLGGFAVKGGYSGGPVWDRIARAVVGMVTGNAKHPTVDPRVGFMLPFALLLDRPEFVRVGKAPLEFGQPELSSMLAAIAGDLERDQAIVFLTREIREFRDDPVSRYWVYHTLGAIGGARVEQLLRIAIRTEDDDYARSGAEEALATA
ncbi:trypsin-like peptidase domain-containing protein [Sphingomonas sp. BIUV-7]|uniref:Trypsin-like peptidase domain-containing protein n=1 Tax=Sphingomonas natans TaxID=3063330 RepID=A0ABT8Y969_9SPHN|nr:trypsin-like peptidase domain-containing protein [Sphingomonas sp. BIUV-7]MDO6414388.1 trypsin-like peptidase domain-containing protein [Sphingomonas sp. BIUV-7]